MALAEILAIEVAECVCATAAECQCVEETEAVCPECHGVGETLPEGVIVPQHLEDDPDLPLVECETCKGQGIFMVEATKYTETLWK